MAKSVYRSERYTLSAVTAADSRIFDVRGIPKRGPTGRRNVIKRAFIECQYDVSTGGGVTAFGPTMQNAFQRVRFEDLIGPLVRDLSGVQMRALNFHEYGSHLHPTDPANVTAAGANQTGRVVYMIDFAPTGRA